MQVLQAHTRTRHIHTKPRSTSTSTSTSTGTGTGTGNSRGMCPPARLAGRAAVPGTQLETRNRRAELAPSGSTTVSGTLTPESSAPLGSTILKMTIAMMPQKIRHMKTMMILSVIIRRMKARMSRSARLRLDLTFIMSVSIFCNCSDCCLSFEAVSAPNCIVSAICAFIRPSEVSDLSCVFDASWITSPVVMSSTCRSPMPLRSASLFAH
mmetsp:Transcript_19620/g.45103  ORF Transcript_19620/g.45103 Transcript_19620/m.45103 type:complete len:210 (+) Transcript_19620:190-819(+)